MDNPIKKRADSAATESTQRITGIHKPGTTKLQKIIYDTKLIVGDYSVRIFRVKYFDPTGFNTIKQFSFDGRLSYRDCLCKIPQTIDITSRMELRNTSIDNYLKKIRNN